MILMIIAVVIKGFAFLVFLLLFILMISVLALTNEAIYLENEVTESDLYIFSYFDIYWMMMFNVWDDTYGDSEWYQLNYTYSFLVGVVFLNLYISIVGDIYDEFVSNKETIDIKEQLILTLDAGRLV